MYDAMSAEELINWKEFVKNYDYEVYQVGTNADGSDKKISDYKTIWYQWRKWF